MEEESGLYHRIVKVTGYAGHPFASYVYGEACNGKHYIGQTTMERKDKTLER
jgi:hypothetical protein